MNNRRKFLLQSSMAAAAFVAAKPFNVLANYSSTFNEGRFQANSITFVHTTCNDFSIATKVKRITEKNSSVVLLHAGKNSTTEMQHMNFDATHHSLNEEHINGYKIISKDNIKIGIIAINSNENDPSNKANDLAEMLKKDKKCHLVVCISQLGYKNKNKEGDMTLAEKSENIDIIVGKYNPNSPKQPVTAGNINKAEVVIQYLDDIEAALGKINVGFDQFGGKYSISF